MTPEAKVKRVVTKQLKEMGAYYFFPATGGYGRSGGTGYRRMLGGFFLCD